MKPKRKSRAPMSQRAYAKRRGVTSEAVSKAIAAGRLRDSIVMVNGTPKVSDADLADREWKENTKPRAGEPRAPLPRDLPAYFTARAVREGSAARREAAQAEIAELELAQRRGATMLVAEARRDVMAKFAIVRNRLLGVPSRVAQRLPHLAAEVVPVLDEIIREALEALADGAGDDGDSEET